MISHSFVLFAATLLAFQHHHVLSYEPAQVKLEGTLTIKQKYGPPNYGETPSTDEKVQVTMLSLSEPVDLQADPKSDINNETIRDITEMQLVFGKNTYKRLLGRKVVVEGTLFRSHTGHHYTAVLMNVTSIHEARQAGVTR